MPNERQSEESRPPHGRTAFTFMTEHNHLLNERAIYATVGSVKSPVRIYAGTNPNKRRNERRTYLPAGRQAELKATPSPLREFIPRVFYFKAGN